MRRVARLVMAVVLLVLATAACFQDYLSDIAQSDCGTLIVGDEFGLVLSADTKSLYRPSVEREIDGPAESIGSFDFFDEYHARFRAVGVGEGRISVGYLAEAAYGTYVNARDECDFVVFEHVTDVTDLSGTWTLKFETDSNPAGCAAASDQSTITIEQGASNSLIFSGEEAGGNHWPGQANGRNLAFGGERSEEGGVTTADFHLEVFPFSVPSYTLATGTEEWSWTPDGGSQPTCVGTSEVTASKVD